MASPSLASPPSSPSNSSPGSPQLPALSSPFSITPHDRDYDEAPADDTPTRVREVLPLTNDTPSWMMDELEEEWIEQEYDTESGTDEEEEEDDMDLDASRDERSYESHSSNHSNRKHDNSFSPSPSTGNILETPYPSTNKPRVPSSLRFGFPSSATTSSSQHTDLSDIYDQPSQSPPNHPSPTSSAGTFVVRDTASDTYRRHVQGAAQDESQLQAAVRALKGPASGLGAPVTEEGYKDNSGAVRTPVERHRLGGLRRMFDLPSPPPGLFFYDHLSGKNRWCRTDAVYFTAALSIVQAPSADAFTFTPPVAVPRTSWKSLPHFSPSDSTPRASCSIRISDDNTEHTPSHPTKPEAPALKPKDRYLHSQITVPSLLPQHLGKHVPTVSPLLETQAEGPGLKLFEFQYDTFTRNHLAALVEEIDGLGSDAGGEQFSSGKDATWETSFVDVSKSDRGPGENEGDGDSPGSDGRSNKRIRLSPLERSARRRRERSERKDLIGAKRGLLECSKRAPVVRRRREMTPASLQRAARWIGVDDPPDEPQTTNENDVGQFPLSAPTTPSTMTATSSSLPFAHSRDQSMMFMNSPSARSTSRLPQLTSLPTPQPTTRDRLGEANALLNRIRARTEQKERIKLAQTEDNTLELVVLRSPPKNSSCHTKTGSSATDPISLRPPPEPPVERFAVVSPRKLLRRLSASDEVDQEIFGTGMLHESLFHSTFSSSVAINHETEPPLPHLAAAASASLRSALGESRDTPRTPTRSSVNGYQGELTPNSARRHFARTPVSSVSIARRSRNKTDDIFPGVGSNPGSSGEREHEDGAALDDPATASFSLATVTPVTPVHPRGHSRHGSLTTIGPTDVEALLASAGVPSRMVFDQDQKRWIKSARKPPSGPDRLERIAHEDEFEDSGSTEDDPFRDFDTTRASDADLAAVTNDDQALSGLGITAGTPPVPPQLLVSPPDVNHFAPPHNGRPSEHRNPAEEDSAEWTGFTGESGEFDASQKPAENPQPDSTLSQTLDESPLHLYQASGDTRASTPPSPPISGPSSTPPQVNIFPADISQPLQFSIEALSDSPLPAASHPNSPLPTPKPSPSTPRPPPATQTAAPRSALKGAGRSQSVPGLSTPVALASVPKPPRSVSFSDGKLHGPIEGLGGDVAESERQALGSRLKFEVGAGSGMLMMMGAESFGEPGSLEFDHPESPLAGSSARFDRVLTELQDTGPSFLTVLQASNSLYTKANPAGNERSPDSSKAGTSIMIGSFESAPKVRPKGSRSTTASQSRTFRRTTSLDATLMTECSFGVSRDRLVQYITDVEPFEPDWEGLRSISLSNKGAESMVRLKDFLPNLDELDL